MSEQQLFLGDPVVIGFSATRRDDGTWTLIARCVREYQSWDSAGYDEYPGLSPTELEQTINAIAWGLLDL